MRIIHTIPAISDEASGPSYSVVRLCESLLEQGTQVTLAALDWANFPRVPSFYRCFPLGLGPRRLGHSPAMMRWLDAQVQTRKVDIIHNHGMWQMNSVYPGLISLRRGCPLVTSPRGAFSTWAFSSGSLIKRAFWPLAQRPALTKTTCFHATAYSEYESIRGLGFRQPVAIIPNGVDIPPWGERRHDQKRTLLFLGRIHPVKGVDFLLRAWGAVQDRFPDWSLRIVGNDASFHAPSGYLSEMRQLSASLGLVRVEFSGVLYGEAKWQAYREADLFVLPTHSENFGISVAEALAAGTPAVVSRGAPWAGLLTEGAGKWIDIGLDPLVAALEEMLSRSQPELIAMGRRGRAWMQRDFSWHIIGRQMADVYEWILGDAASPPATVKLC